MPEREIPPDELRGGGYLAIPDGKGPHPGIVVIHEADGLNDHIKAVSRRLSDEGYMALAVDLFAGRNRAICMARYMAGLLGGSVNRFGIDDLKSALTYLAKLEDVDAQRMGAIGFCMGGSFAVAWACTDARLKAIAPFYASNPRPLDAVKRLCPVVGSYPEKDFTARSARSLDGALTEYGVKHDIKIYAGARHSFFNDQGHAYDKEAADDSWRRVLKFFASTLVTQKA